MGNSTVERHTCYEAFVHNGTAEEWPYRKCTTILRIGHMLYGHLRLTVLHSGTHIL